MQFLKEIHDKKIIEINKKIYDLYFDIQKETLIINDKNNDTIRKTTRGYSVDINYVIDKPKYQIINQFTQIYPYSKAEDKRLRFMEIEPWNYIIEPPSWPIHKDKSLGVMQKKALVMPIINCNQQTKTRWYETEDEKVNELSHVYLLDKTCKIKCIFETVLYDFQPYEVLTDVWHDIQNSTNQMRVACGWYYESIQD